MMDFDELKKILEMVREHELTEFELERDNFKIRIRKNAGGQLTASLPPAPNAAPAPAPPAYYGGSVAPPEAPPVLAPADEGAELAVLKSPIVGTFYRASEPGAPPFADVGALVKKGQVLCI